MSDAKGIITKLLLTADIHVNGKRPWDIRVNDERFYSRVLSGGSLALGESYMDGWWDSEQIDGFINHVLHAKLETKVQGIKNMIIPYIKSKIMNIQKVRKEKGGWHYNIGNELYISMLDKNMQYSCAYWRNAKNLDKAQEDKMDLICKKLKLKKGETLLDIGCGWGGLLRYAAKRYRVKGVGVTLSKEQARYAQENSKGLPVDIRLEDYRKLNGYFDKIVSVGMIEHVGPKNYKEYMNVAHRCLKDDGIFLLHTIGSSISLHDAGEPWTDKYIFPDGRLPSIKQISHACEGLFIIEDMHGFGSYYDKTLMAWHANFVKAWPKLKGRYNERFYRMWKYYLLSSAGGFRARHLQLWQIILTKGNIGAYERVQ